MKGSQSEAIQKFAIVRQHPLALPALFLLFVWLQLFLSLTPSWRLGTYYDYGWFVPLAAGWFFWNRWQRLSPFRRPLSAPPWSARVDRILLALLVASIASIFLLRIIGRYDSFWRPPRLLHATMVITIHHLLLARFLGWKASRYFLPPTLLCLTAVPMPYQWEQAFIQQATQTLMTFSEPICHFQGLPVDLSGSALTMNGEVLEIDDGCSGIRSFQSLFMMGVFVGELFLLPWLARIGIVLLGFLLAFLCNLVRVIVLTEIFFRSGEDAFHQWHDWVGTSTFAVSALGVLAVGKVLQPDTLSSPSFPPPRTPVSDSTPDSAP